MGNQNCNKVANEILRFPNEMQKVSGKKQLPNPGTIYDLHRNLIDIIPKWVFGAEIGIRWLFAQNKYVYGNWSLSHGSPTGFRFGGFYSKNVAENVITCPHIECDINPSTLATNLIYTYSPDCRYICRFETKNQRDCTENILKVDHYGNYSTMSAAFVNPSRGVGRFTIGYLTSITSRLALGTEIDLEWYQSIKKMEANFSLAAKYRADEYTVATTCSYKSFDITYWSRFNDNYQYGTSIVYNKKLKHAVGAIYYQMKTMGSRVRGMVNSDLVVGMTYERKIPNICFNFGVSILHHIPNNKFSTGIKLEFAPW